MLIAGGLYCEPLAAVPPSPMPAVAAAAAGAGQAQPAAGARLRACDVKCAYEDEPLPAEWTPEQCAAFDARCAGYHARTARIDARVSQLVGAWHAVPMTLG